jgi:hypothetical protein
MPLQVNFRSIWYISKVKDKAYVVYVLLNMHRKVYEEVSKSNMTKYGYNSFVLLQCVYFCL